MWRRKWLILGGIVSMSVGLAIVAYLFVMYGIRETAAITPITAKVAAPIQFEIVKNSESLVSVDVFTVNPSAMDETLKLAAQLLDAASKDKDFIAGAVHKGLPPGDQPLDEWGFVPRDERWVAVYALWHRSGREKGLTGTEEGRTLLRKIGKHSDHANQMLSSPSISLYEPTLLDATGELCGGIECDAGLGIGPVIDENTSRASFINVFETTPEKQDLLLEATYDIMPIAREHNGYLRTALHRSLDGNHVVNYGQYETYRQIADMYYSLNTFIAFGNVLFKDVTPQSTSFLGMPIGTYPRLRCYTVEKVLVASKNE